uniref:Nucleoside ABC transporter ATP-binding protein n=1 Tax=Chlorobium chlorochromatii (strain CaD3) TaxID=340177 RepID=Q3AQH1_CHLCH
MSVAIELKHITKKFGSFTANHNISLEIAEGSIHAFVGENGAGKSTLTKLLYGMHQPTSGDIVLHGTSTHFSSPRDAIRAGIGMVHQHFMLIEELTVTENIMLGYEQASLFGSLPLKKAKERIAADALASGLTINPDARISSLSVGEQQRVEILKLLFRNASIMLFDEPTAVLTPAETEQLFTTLRALRAQSKTIVLITHKLDEVLSVADTVSVMRQGEIVATKSVAGVTREELARLMVGRDVLLRVENSPHATNAPVLEINNLTYRALNGNEKLRQLTLTLHAGEVYGIAGVEGNGQSELLQALWGLVPEGVKVSGNITMQGSSLLGKSAAAIAALGVSHAPENRLHHAIIGDYSVSDNLIFGRHREATFHHGMGFNRATVERFSNAMIADFDIRCTNALRQPISALSGGNQQKVVIARELTRPNLKLLILAQPTRGVDIGAIETIHKKILAARTSGIAILLISSELEEIIALSTRIGCIYKGTIRHQFSAEEVERNRQHGRAFSERIGTYIT